MNAPDGHSVSTKMASESIVPDYHVCISCGHNMPHADFEHGKMCCDKPRFGDDESESESDDDDEEKWFDRKYPKASCHDCGTKLNGHTVEFCGQGCETWYCSECIEEREFPWCCEQCGNYTGSDCNNCGHTLTAEELAEGVECCDKPDHTPE